MDNTKTALDYRKEEKSLFDIARDIDNGKITNSYDEKTSAYEFGEILMNILDNVPFKPIVAQQSNDGKYTIDSKVIKVLCNLLKRLREDFSVAMPKGEPLTKANIARIEDFKFDLINVKPSQSNFDKSRILKY